jgi:hypothetical protein
MGKKKKPVDATEEKTTSPRVVFLLPRSLLEVIDQQADAADRTRTAEIIRALKAHYRQQGLWPPPRPEGG